MVCIDSGSSWHNWRDGRSLLLFVSLCLINVEEEEGAPFVVAGASLDRDGVFTLVVIFVRTPFLSPSPDL